MDLPPALRITFAVLGGLFVLFLLLSVILKRTGGSAVSPAMRPGRLPEPGSCVSAQCEASTPSCGARPAGRRGGR